MKKQPTPREKWINHITLKGDGETTKSIWLRHGLWIKYREELDDLLIKNDWCFPDYKKGSTSYEELADYGPANTKGQICKDAWGCVWVNLHSGLEGQITEHPLSDLSKFNDYNPPDPMTQAERGPRRNWDEFRQYMVHAREAGKVSEYSCWGERFFERTHFLLCMEKMMIAVAECDPVLDKVIGMILQHNMAVINQVLECGTPDLVSFGDDLGSQKSLMISPASWRRYFKPGFRAEFAACRTAGTFVSLHSDGQIFDILDDLVEIGVNKLNCQVSLIGINRVAEKLKGRICISANIDSQFVMPLGTSHDVRDLVKEIVMKIGSPEGGLELQADLCPDVPLENIRALLGAIKEYRYYWVNNRNGFHPGIG